jgi:hypothetical protein
MQVQILFRTDRSSLKEEEVAKSFGYVINKRSMVQAKSLIIPRYSLLPFAYETLEDIKCLGGTPINDYNQYLYVADLKNWVNDLKDFTPKTYSDFYLLSDNSSYVIKGETNSKKFLWQSHMFAANKTEAIRIQGELLKDSLFEQQQIYAREYVPLKTYYKGLGGLPVTKEFRFFVLYGKVISSGFYWSDHIETLRESGIHPDVNDVPISFLEEIINKIGDNNNFYVVDVAETETGEWIVIELNAGEMSGLSECSPEDLYRNLYSI